MHCCYSLSFAISIVFSLILAVSSAPLTSDNGTTIYEVLSEFGLPIGLVPDSVKEYSLSEDGRFLVELEKPCYVHFDYLVYYDRKITGILKVGSISSLAGIEVKKLFLWLDVDEIRVDLPPSDSIYFQVGWINKRLDVDQFQTLHACQNNGLGSSCRGSSWSDLLTVTEPMREIQTLITE